MPEREACVYAKKMTEKALEYVNEAEASTMPDGYGDYLLIKEKDGVQETRNLMVSLRKEGVSDDDIKWYYNMGALRNWMYANISNVIIMVHLQTYQEEGMSYEEAASRLRRNMPVFGKPKQIPDGFGYCDRNLPPPLQRRVNLYISACMEKNAIKFQKDVQGFSSLNAYIREEMRLNKLEEIEDYGAINTNKEIARFKNNIAQHEDQLFGIELYWEVARISDYSGIIKQMETKPYENIVSRAGAAITRAKELLAQIESYPEFAEYMRLFQFPPISGHPGLDDMTMRAKLLVEAYEKLFPMRPRNEPLTDNEYKQLLNEAAEKFNTV